MSWREASEPVRMHRVAVVAPASRLRDALVRTADSGAVQVDRPDDRRGAASPPGPAGRLLQRLHPTAPPAPRLSRERPDLEGLERDRRLDLVAGEAELESVAAAAVVRGEVAALVGWAPAGDLPALADTLADVGAAVVRLPQPRGVDPPTRLHTGGQVRRSFAPLVATYATVPYSDLDPTLPAGLAYVLMFGMMFGDVGHGALLVAIALLLRVGRPARFAQLRSVWPFLAAAGVSAATFGLLYGEFFGPTGVVPVL
jgi:V/A-type H+-transporting ATPase subunit I